MKIKLLILPMFLLTACLSSCNSARPATNETGSSTNDNQDFDVTLEENDATYELVEMARNEPITINFEDYGGFEKVGPLGRSLTTDNTRITTKAGDIVLYQENQIVMFYGSNTWSYTMLGHVEDLTYWEEALGNGDVVVTFTLLEDE